MSENKNPVEIKIETTQIKSGDPVSIGLMVEVTAPTSDEVTLARPDQGIVFVVDRSGSMGGGRLDMIKTTILDTIGRVDKNDYLSIVTFDTSVDVVLPMTRVRAMDVRAVRRAVSEMTTGGSTNIELGYREGLAQAAKAPQNVETTVILLSDGQANAGQTDPVALGRLAAAATEHLINTSTLGIGEGYDEKILVELANAGIGEHFAAVRQDEATLGLEDQINGLLGRTATEVKLDINRYGSIRLGAKLRAIQPVRSLITHATADRIQLPDLASGEERNFVFEMTFSAKAAVEVGNAGDLLIYLSFFDQTTQRTFEIERSFKIEVIAADQWVEPVRDEDIVMELANLRAQDAKARAIDLMRAGRGDEARELLRQVGANLEELEIGFALMSDRNRGRARRNREEFFELSYMSDEEFIKRGEESVKRGRESKPDPRKRDQQNPRDQKGDI